MKPKIKKTLKEIAWGASLLATTFSLGACFVHYMLKSADSRLYFSNPSWIRYAASLNQVQECYDSENIRGNHWEEYKEAIRKRNSGLDFVVPGLEFPDLDKDGKVCQKLEDKE